MMSRDTVLGKHKLRSQTQVSDIHRFLTMTIYVRTPPKPSTLDTMIHTYKRIKVHKSVNSALKGNRSRLAKKIFSSRFPLAVQTEMRRAKSVEQKQLHRRGTLTTRPYTDRFKTPHVAHNKTKDKGTVEENPAFE